MPSLSDEEYAALKEDIRINGQQIPILIDEDNNILDGHNRWEICQELGIEPIVEVKEGLADDEAKWNYALRLNNTRRHMTLEQKQTLVRSELRRNPNRTDAAIARSLGVSGTMVGRYRREMQEEAERETWDPRYRAAIEEIVELTRQQVDSWARLADLIVEIDRDWGDNFDEMIERIGLDEHTAAEMFHNIETWSWDRWPSLQRTFRKLVPYRQRLTHGITFTDETGFSDHPWAAD